MMPQDEFPGMPWTLGSRGDMYRSPESPGLSWPTPISALWGPHFRRFAYIQAFCIHTYIYIYIYIYTYVHIYIYICAVGSITWPHFGHFRVNNLATSRSITWPPFFEPIKIVFCLFVFSGQFSGGGAKLVFLKVVLGQNVQKPYKNSFFGTLLLDAKETEKQEENNAPKNYTHFWGALKTGRK